MKRWNRLTLTFAVVGVAAMVGYHISDEAGAPKWVRLSLGYTFVGVIVLGTAVNVGSAVIGSTKPKKSDDPDAA